MTEQRLWPTRKHRRHPTAPESELAVTDGVDAPVNAMQPPGGETVLDHRRTDPERQQLPPSHHAVLPFGQDSQHSVGLPIQRVHMTP